LPSPAATALTQAHRRDLSVLAGVIGRRVAALAATAALADIDAWWDQVASEAERVVTTGQTAAAALAARYLRQHSALEGVRITPRRAPVDQAQIATALRVTGPVAFKTNLRDSGSDTVALRAMQERLRGSAQRLTLTGDRQTVMDAVTESPAIAGYRRVTSGTPCAFCSMLATRGAVYSKATVGFQAHDHCSCTPEPLYEHEPEPASITRLRAEWDQVTAEASGTAKLTAWRRHWDHQTAST
jgi:hypothetical protein